MSGTAYAARDVWDSLRSRPGRAGVAFAAMATGMLALALMFGVLRGVGERADALTAELGAHAAVLSAAFLGEPPRLYHGVAFVLVVAGIVISSRRA